MQSCKLQASRVVSSVVSGVVPSVITEGYSQILSLVVNSEGGKVALSQLPALYKAEYHTKLDCTAYGYKKLLEMVEANPLVQVIGKGATRSVVEAPTKEHPDIQSKSKLSPAKFVNGTVTPKVVSLHGGEATGVNDVQLHSGPTVLERFTELDSKELADNGVHQSSSSLVHDSEATMLNDVMEKYFFDNVVAPGFDQNRATLFRFEKTARGEHGLFGSLLSKNDDNVSVIHTSGLPPMRVDANLANRFEGQTTSRASTASQHVALNVHEPFCLITVGVQGSGKSHTIGTVVESCTIPAPPCVKLHTAMPALILHYDQAVGNPCECTSLVMPANALLTTFKDHLGTSRPLPSFAAQRMIILTSPTYYRQRREIYKDLPRTKVVPLLFPWETLGAGHLKTLMKIRPDDNQLYVATMLNLLRGYQREGKIPEYQKFKSEIEGMMIGTQTGPLKQRLDLLDSLVAESYSEELKAGGFVPTPLHDIVEPGTVIVADLTDPLLDASSANGIFQVLLEQFRDVETRHGKLVVFDEAHKYLDGAKSGSLAESIVDTVRQMRHYGLRIAISTQSPTSLPPELLELSSVVVMHRFHSRDWHSFLEKKIPLPDKSFEVVTRLNPGQALVFTAKHNLAPGGSFGEGDNHHQVLKMQIRKRLTADGGASLTNRGSRTRT
jgi:hypothetical protein